MSFPRHNKDSNLTEKIGQNANSDYQPNIPQPHMAQDNLSEFDANVINIDDDLLNIFDANDILGKVGIPNVETADVGIIAVHEAPHKNLYTTATTTEKKESEQDAVDILEGFKHDNVVINDDHEFIQAHKKQKLMHQTQNINLPQPQVPKQNQVNLPQSQVPQQVLEQASPSSRPHVFNFVYSAGPKKGQLVPYNSTITVVQGVRQPSYFHDATLVKPQVPYEASVDINTGFQVLGTDENAISAIYFRRENKNTTYKFFSGIQNLKKDSPQLFSTNVNYTNTFARRRNINHFRNIDSQDHEYTPRLTVFINPEARNNSEQFFEVINNKIQYLQCEVKQNETVYFPSGHIVNDPVNTYLPPYEIKVSAIKYFNDLLHYNTNNANTRYVVMTPQQALLQVANINLTSILTNNYNK